MAGYRNPMRAAEPYEESQAGESATETSPEALNAFYQEMERKETIERKLSKRNSGKSIWSRKSVKRSTTAPLDPVAPSFTDRSPRPQPSSSGHSVEHAGYDGDDQIDKVDDHRETADFRPQISSPRSIIPDNLKELPASYQDAWASVPLPSFTVRYNLHNPRGPRWYKNHHLLHPSQVRPSVRPPTFFSPSFPPISTSSATDHIYDSADLAGSSRTPSNSPLPTPDSSQTRVADGGKSRSRKTSQTTPDNVDLLDVTDPWGTNWHHHSPYDYGYGTSTSPEVYDPPNRPRRASFQGHHKSVIPSPLSQSTSAIHLQASNVVGAHIPRKLSKRRTPVGHVFGASKDLDRNARSAPVTPLDILPTSHPSGPLGVDAVATTKRMSNAPTVGPPPTLTPKKEKRISVLGRLVRKFSILRRSQDDQQVTINNMQDSWHHVDVQDVNSEPHYSVLEGRSSPEKLQADLSRRVPPPSTHVTSPQDIPRAHGQADRSSSISLETPITTGKLTIANPDALESPSAPSFSFQESPLPPLPPEKPQDVVWAPSLDLHSSPQLSLYLAPLISTSPGPQSLSYDIREDKSSIPTPSFSSAPMTQLSPSVNHEYTPRPLPSEVLSPSIPTSPIQPTSSNQEIQSVRSQLRDNHDNPGVKSPRLPVTTPHAGAGATYPQHSIHGTERQPVSPNKPSITHGHPEGRHSRISNRSLDNRSLDKQPAISQTLMSEYFPAHVPFPVAEILKPPKLHSFASYQDSPLSTSSMLVNPPTPYDPPAKLSTPESLPPHPPLKISTSEVKRSSREPSPLNPSGRQTETFKLVRSLSGNIYASTETIVAAGQQWEVVESKDKGKSPKSKDKDASLRRPPEDGSNRRDDGRRSRGELEGGSSRKEIGHSSRREETHSGRKEEGRSRKEEGHSRKEDRHSRKEEGHSRKEEGHTSRREEGHTSRREEGYRDHEPSSSRKPEGSNHKQPENTRPDPEGSRHREQEASSSRREREGASSRKGREEVTSQKVPEGRNSRKEQESGSYRKEKEREASRKEETRMSRREDDGHNRKEETSSSRKDHRRESKTKVETEVDVDHRHKDRSNRAHKQIPQELRPTSSKALPTSRIESDHRELPRADENRSSRRRDDTRDRRSERRSTEPAYDKPQPPQPLEEPVPRPLERHPSTSARPTSELPSAAELNAMRAKEAWDMERLWKARSLNGSDMPTNSIPAYSLGSTSDLAASQSAVYGSSHTAFVVQTPFQGHAPQIYHSMPTAPPPFIYSPSSFPTIHGSASSFDSPIIQGPHLNYLNSNQRPISSVSRPTLSNPLPAPPQESPYEAAPLPSIPASRRSADYWTKYAGITTAH